MFSSEQTFTINGDNYTMLDKVLELAINLSGWKSIKAFYYDEKGLVLCPYKCGDSVEYPFVPSITTLREHIRSYINDLSSEDILRLAGEEPDNDGTVRLGWEVFYPLWYGENKITNYEQAAILAVRPCWIVYGK